MNPKIITNNYNKRYSKKAVIYVRVSSIRQKEEGHGLESQEVRCRQYAQAKGYKVLAVFKDEGVSGGVTDRPGMEDLLKFLDENALKEGSVVVIVDDIKRLARDIQGHFTLKTAIYSRNGVLESPSHLFEDTPEGKFVETVLAGASELERNQNKRQVINRMKARLTDGYWCFCPPKGLKYEVHKESGRSNRKLVPNEPYASIFKDAIEKYASNYLETLDEVRNYILVRYSDNSLKDTVSIHGVQKILGELLYSGYLEYPEWNIERKKAVHEGFITIDTYNQVQKKLRDNGKKNPRKDSRVEFSLRGFLVCSSCGKPLTGSNTTGRSNKYGYYWCKTASCPLRYKTIKRVTVETQFEQLIKQVKLSQFFVNQAIEALEVVWNKEQESFDDKNNALQRQIEAIEKEIEVYTQRVAKTKSESLIPVYEDKISELVEEVKSLRASLRTSPYNDINFGTASELVLNTLENPMTLWKRDTLRDKRTVFKMYFKNPVVFDTEQGFGTATLDDTVRVFKKLETSKTNLVEMRGIEPLC